MLKYVRVVDNDLKDSNRSQEVHKLPWDTKFFILNMKGEQCLWIVAHGGLMLYLYIMHCFSSSYSA